MNNKKIALFASLVLASGSAFAQSSLLEAAGKQLATDAVKSAAPGAVETLDDAKTLKNAAEAAPENVTNQAEQATKEAAEQKLKEAVPSEATQAVDTVKSGKAAVDAAPKSTGEASEAVKQKATQKATEKAFDLLH